MFKHAQLDEGDELNADSLLVSLNMGEEQEEEKKMPLADEFDLLDVNDDE